MATCALDEIAISEARSIFPRTRDDDRAAVLRRVPDDRHDDGRDEELRQAGRPREAVERVHQDLAHERRDHGRDAERDERPREAPRMLARFCRVGRAVPAQVSHRGHDIEDEQDDRDRNRQQRKRVPVGIAVKARDRKARGRRARAASTSASWSESERRSSRAPSGPSSIASPSTSRMFETTLPVSEPRTTSGQIALIASNAMISSGALPKLALRKPPTPGADVLARVLRRLADQPRERDERGGREHEQAGVADVKDVPSGNRDRREDERSPEEPSRHGP